MLFVVPKTGHWGEGLGPLGVRVELFVEDVARLQVAGFVCSMVGVLLFIWGPLLLPLWLSRPFVQQYMLPPLGQFVVWTL